MVCECFKFRPVLQFYAQVNILPSNKISDVTKLKAFSADILNFARMMISLLDSVENTVGKGENAGSNAYFLQVVNSWDCVVKG